ncbi:TetR family transcriptional regulator [Streptomyces sp. NPDC012508]|uniref:TetR family transcriptional regulator n=1 Tax=Streptomyces sp. NPDC012508 TaxID=3364837 RepID=UPI00368995AA
MGDSATTARDPHPAGHPRNSRGRLRRTRLTSASIAEILERSGISKGALYFHFPTREYLAAAIFAEQLAVALPPQESTVQELVDVGLVLAYRLQTEPLVRASVALSLEQGATGLDRTSAFDL